MSDKKIVSINKHEVHSFTNYISSYTKLSRAASLTNLSQRQHKFLYNKQITKKYHIYLTKKETNSAYLLPISLTILYGIIYQTLILWQLASCQYQRGICCGICWLELGYGCKNKYDCSFNKSRGEQNMPCLNEDINLSPVKGNI